MNLRELLGTIARTYDRDLGLQAHAAKLLRTAGDALGSYTSPRYVIEGSSGKGTAAFVPWIAVFDPDETTSATHGMYVVYLFAADMRTIFLTLLQGSEDLRKAIKGRALDNLSNQAKAIRQHLDPELVRNLDDHVTLGAPSDVQRPRYYEAGTIAARRYEVAKLPTDAELSEELARFINLCQHAIDCRQRLTLSKSNQPATREIGRPPTATGEFKSKDDANYQQFIKARTITKSRKHETYLKLFNDHLLTLGFTTGSPHPRDMIASRGTDEWLIEAKVLQHGDGVKAAREALAQLLWYRHCHYPEPRTVRLLALFNEPVRPKCVEVLQANGIECVWPDCVGWFGTPGAVTAGFASGASADNIATNTVSVE